MAWARRELYYSVDDECFGLGSTVGNFLTFWAILSRHN